MFVEWSFEMVSSARDQIISSARREQSAETPVKTTDWVISALNIY